MAENTVQPTSQTTRGYRGGAFGLQYPPIMTVDVREDDGRRSVLPLVLAGVITERIVAELVLFFPGDDGMLDVQPQRIATVGTFLRGVWR